MRGLKKTKRSGGNRFIQCNSLFLRDNVLKICKTVNILFYQ